MTEKDAIEFILVGAMAVGVGTVLFRDPWVILRRETWSDSIRFGGKSEFPYDIFRVRDG